MHIRRKFAALTLLAITIGQQNILRTLPVVPTAEAQSTIPYERFFPKGDQNEITPEVIRLIKKDVPDFDSIAAGKYRHPAYDGTTLNQVCRAMGYAQSDSYYYHAFSSCSNDVVVSYSNGRWSVVSACSIGSANKQLRCFDPLPACQNNLDDDGDGKFDSEDPGCSNPNDNDETDQKKQCQDGIDNDGDGAVDTADFSCSSSTDDDETNPKAACQDGIDNDGDGKVDLQDPGCSGNQDNDEFNTTQCSDNIDNDGDGAKDYPADFSCSSSSDDDETNPKAACQDGIDNDGDGLIDYPQDPGCTSKQDNDEREANGPKCDNGRDDDFDGEVDFVKNSATGDLDCSSPADDEKRPGPDATFTLTTPIQIGQNFVAEASSWQNPNNRFDVNNDGSVTQQDMLVVYNEVNEHGERKLSSGSNPPPYYDVDGDGYITTRDSGQIMHRLEGRSGKNPVSYRWKVTLIQPTGNQDVTPGNNTARTITVPGTVRTTQSSSAYYKFDLEVTNDEGATATATKNGEVDGSQCKDGIDNDNDGVIDLADPGCSNPDDDDESDKTTQCQDGIDNDGDGVKDYPADFSCSSKTDNDETLPKSQCQDGIDNDNDGVIDLQDPGCANNQDNDESDKTTQCQDGVDNDNDGAVDYPADFSCSSKTDNDETLPKSQCQDGIDNDNDGVIDLQDPGCANNQDNDESDKTTQCQDGVDNDGDTLIDYPQDPGCTSKTDDDESPQNSVADVTVTLSAPSSVFRTQQITYTADAKNAGPTNAENVSVTLPFANGLFFDANASSANCIQSGNTIICNNFSLAKNETTSLNIVFITTNQIACSTSITARASITESGIDPNTNNNQSQTVTTRVNCAQCQDGIDNDNDGATDFPNDFSCSSPTDDDETNPKSQCQDGIDNDNDGVIDLQDPGCANNQDNDESDKTTQCQDGVDNDNDGAVDYPADFSCSSKTDNDETLPKSQCQDGIDNDNDSYVDYPQDPGCTSKQDNDEFHETQCNNGRDDDGDGKIDYPQDVGCSSVNDTDERGGEIALRAAKTTSAQQVLPGATFDWRISASHEFERSGAAIDMIIEDTLPNGTTPLSAHSPDNTGFSCAIQGQKVTCTIARFDYGESDDILIQTKLSPNASGTYTNCATVKSDNVEITPSNNQACNSIVTKTPQCRDGIDNDNDGVIDAQDPGCSNPDDDDEGDKTTQCQDGIDNDNDGAVDYPADFSCSSKTDNDETLPKSQCQDGIDNDNDGVIDLQDPGCANNQDNDESDKTTQCQDGVDNDGDTLIDYPQDPGCTSKTDDDESPQNSVSDLVAYLNAPASVFRTQQITYSATAENNGPTSANNVAISLPIPSGLFYDGNASDPSCIQRGNTISCENFSLNVSQSRSFSVVFITTMQIACGSSVSTQANVTASTVDPVGSNNTSPVVTTRVNCAQCQDGIDNDNDGATDFPNDFSCSSPTDDDETLPKSQCQDGIDNDNDGVIDLQDPGCANNQDNDESDKTTQCQDGIDNDNDGATDYPADFSCSSPTDDDESNPKAACQDGIDNDNDGKIDFPQDPGCSSNQDNDEFNAAQADLFIQKFGPATVTKGGTAIYTVHVTNLGPDTATTVTVDDAVPTGLSFKKASSSGNCDLSGGTVRCTNVTLTQGNSYTYIIAFDVGQAATCGGAVNNTATVTSPVADPVLGNNQSQTVASTVNCPQPTFAITKTDGKATAAPGDLLTYTISVSNTSSANATNVAVTDTLPAGVSFVSATAGGQHANGLVTWNTNIAPNASTVLTVTVSVNSNVANSTVLTNTATVDSVSAQDQTTVVVVPKQCSDGIDNDNDGATDYPADFSCSSPTDDDESNPKAACQDGIDNDNDGKIDFPQDPGCSSNQDNDEFNAAQADLFIQKFGPATVTKGGTAIYTVHVTNLGPDTATTVTVDDAVPTGLSFKKASSSGNCDLSGGTVRCTNVTLTQGNSYTYIIAFDVGQAATCGGAVNNTATVTSPVADPVLGNNQSQTVASTVNCPQPTFAITKTDGKATAAPGDLLTYTISVSNTSSANATNVAVTDTLPAGVSFVSATAGGQHANGLVTWNTNIAPNASTVLTVTVSVNSNVANSTVLTNTATVDSVSAQDQTTVVVVPKQCSDGIDNDNDGATDYPADFSCSSPTDDDESNPKAACQDGIDNDNDGKIDFPQDPGCSSNQDNDEFNAPVQTDLGITLTGPSSAQKNEQISLSALVTNNGPAALSQAAEFSLPMPTGYTLNTQASDQLCHVSASTILCTTNLISINSTQNFTIVLQPTNPAQILCGSSVTNRATITNVPQGDTNASNNQSQVVSTAIICDQCSDGIDNDGDGAIDYPADFSCSGPTDNDESNPKAQCQDGIDNDNDGLVDFPQDPGCDSNQDDNEFNQELHDLYITKSGPVSIQKGNTIIYTLTATNLGPHAATNVHIIDVIPAGLVFNAANSSSNCVVNGGNVICNNFSLQNQESKTVNVAFTVGSAVECNSNIKNIGIVNTSATDLNPIDNRTEISTSARCDSTGGLTITKTDNHTTATPGESLNYIITLQNNSASSMNSVDVSDTLPPELEYISATFGPSVTLSPSDATVLLWSGITVPAFQSVVLTVNTRVKANAQDGAEISNTAQINGGASATDTTRIANQTQYGCVEVTKIAQTYQGVPLTSIPAFTFRLDGSQTTVNDTTGRAVFTNVPVGTHTVSENALTGWQQLSVAPTNGTVVVAAGTQCAHVTFTNKQNSDTQLPTYSITKTDNVGTIQPGQQLTYSISVTNTSSVTANQVRIVDVLPAELTYVSASNNGTPQGSNVVWDNFSLTPGQSITQTLTTQVRNNVAAGTVIFNIAQVIGSANAYTNSANESAQATALDTTVVQTQQTSSSSSSNSSTSSYSSTSNDSAEYENEIVVNETENVINPFSDTSLNNLEGEAAAELYKQGILGGFPDGEFKGYRYTNRAEATKFLLLARYGSVADVTNNNRFVDVRDGEWYVKYVITAAIKGIVEGYTGGYFRPAQSVTTAEFLAMLTRTFGLEQNASYTYQDVDANSWYAAYAGIAQKYDLFPERQNALQPDVPMTRKDIAIAMYQFLKNR